MKNKTSSFLRKNVSIEQNYLKTDNRDMLPICPHFNKVRYFACDITGLYGGLQEIVAEQCYCGHKMLDESNTIHYIPSMVCQTSLDKILEILDYFNSKKGNAVLMPDNEFYVKLIKAENPHIKLNLLQEGCNAVTEYLKYQDIVRRLNDGIRKTDISTEETATEGRKKMYELSDLVYNCKKKPIYRYQTID